MHTPILHVSREDSESLKAIRKDKVLCQTGMKILKHFYSQTNMKASFLKM